ncbi:MAG TPA: hypothetical protein VFL93_08565 [Longimicrobiaceae bacterium]|jgi:hypothetical protein|nr:hypothetical protein [Longimicrobiaceae bacterium]
MSESDLRARADERFQRALTESGARDPRDFYRVQLRELRERDESAFRRALAYFETRLVPAVAAPESDPIAEWLEYGRVLAELGTPGSAVQIDATGRAHPYAPPVPLDHLVLHLPTSTRETAVVVGLPPQLSPAQRAAYELLVRRSLG